MTGGAGYIGAHIVHALQQEGERSVVVDDLSTGEPERIGAAPLVVGSILDEDLLRRTLREHEVRGVVHLAAKKQVGESVAEPLRYYRENVTGTATVLAAAVAEGVESFVFSSSSSTYGLPDSPEPVAEDAPTRPLSPYGETKLVGEWLARDVAAATDLRVVCLRYFNVAGAASPPLGDPGAFNLIPLVFQALDRGEAPRVFGADYPTPDGTCIRDYIHVADVADAHVAALQHLAAGGAGGTYNIGRGAGSSVLEVMRTVAEVTGRAVEPVVVDRRPGDPAYVVAAADRIRRDLGWTARYALPEMVASAWAGWQHRHAGSANRPA